MRPRGIGYARRVLERRDGDPAPTGMSPLSRALLFTVGFVVVGLALGFSGASDGDVGKEVAGFAGALVCGAVLLGFAWMVSTSRRAAMDTRFAARGVRDQRRVAGETLGACLWAWIALRNEQYGNHFVAAAFLLLSLISLVLAADAWRSRHP